MGKVDDFGIKFDLLVWLIYGVLSLVIVKKGWKNAIYFSFGFGWKGFGSDTEIQPWFRFPIPIPNFSRTLRWYVSTIKKKSAKELKMLVYAMFLKISLMQVWLYHFDSNTSACEFK